MRLEPWFGRTRVIVAETTAQALVAAQAASSLALCGGGDAFVVIDSLARHLEAWKLSCSVLDELEIVVAAEEAGSQQRAFYASLTERAHRRKESNVFGEGSVTMLLLQPSASVHAQGEARKASYTAADFEVGGFSQRAKQRVQLLEDKGVVLTEEVLAKLGIPAPGSNHPSGDGGRQAGQHLEELTSLVDGHIDLRENLADAGRVPALDPANSLTRIGVGAATLRPASTSEAMRRVTKALRLELASASDPVHCEPAQRRRAQAYLAALQQPDPRPMPLGEQVALLLAAAEGRLDAVADSMPAASLEGLIAGMPPSIAASAPELLPKISRSGYLSDAQAGSLLALVEAYLEKQ